MKKCPNCDEKMVVVRKQVKRKMNFGDLILVILFFPISLLVVLLNDRSQEKQFFYCPDCDYYEEINLEKKKIESGKKEKNRNKIIIFYFFIFVLLIALGILFIVK